MAQEPRLLIPLPKKEFDRLDAILKELPEKQRTALERLLVHSSVGFTPNTPPLVGQTRIPGPVVVRPRPKKVK